MIGLDTNVLVRFLTQDDPAQGKLAQDLIARCNIESPAYVSREVMVELVWVLDRAYRLPRPDIARAVESLLEAEDLRIESAERVALAAHRFRERGQDFADTMIALAAQNARCDTLFTFDKRAALAAEATLLQAP